MSLRDAFLRRSLAEDAMELGPVEAAEGHDESGAPLGGTPQFG